MAADRAWTRVRKREMPARSQRIADADGAPRSSIFALQRARLLSAAVGALAEQGYEGFSAAGVSERAGVSRRTFYEIFENREQCFAMLLTEAAQRASSVIAELDLAAKAWDERIRMGLWALLCLADSDPSLARVCLVESQRAGGLVEAERERITEILVGVLDEGRAQSTAGSVVSRLTAEALIGAVSAVIATRLGKPVANGGDGGQRGVTGVRGLLGELAGMIVLPYLGPAAARRQIGRALPETPVVVLTGIGKNAEGPDPLGMLPIRFTYRTARVLEAVAELTQTGIGASNRQVAEHAEISDAGQTSKLLGRLQQHGLLENAVTGNHARGEANQWQLTQAGERVLQSITSQAETQVRRNAA
ncbi:MAG TPA: TetR/AcrR family transcriptional regulator [Solirubrobacteraceae bacterium]